MTHEKALAISTWSPRRFLTPLGLHPAVPATVPATVTVVSAVAVTVYVVAPSSPALPSPSLPWASIGPRRRRLSRSVPELATLGGKQHPMDIIFPLFPSNFTMECPLVMSHPLKIESFASTERDRRSNLSIHIVCH